jgi:hypothetical protein
MGNSFLHDGLISSGKVSIKVKEKKTWTNFDVPLNKAMPFL